MQGMNRPLVFMCCLLTALAGTLWLENRAVRSDQYAMAYAYGSFLARKAGGKPLSSMIRPESLAVFKGSGGVVACGVLR